MDLAGDIAVEGKLEWCILCEKQHEMCDYAGPDTFGCTNLKCKNPHHLLTQWPEDYWEKKARRAKPK